MSVRNRNRPTLDERAIYDTIKECPIANVNVFSWCYDWDNYYARYWHNGRNGLWRNGVQLFPREANQVKLHSENKMMPTETRG
mmetsp:Transcript_18339/g.33199  ORF Transcript_18339/g.33199 Transcript_18339/m.33199 type:complete len:83 (+) Transcript_18339:100-348(+)